MATPYNVNPKMSYIQNTQPQTEILEKVLALNEQIVKTNHLLVEKLSKTYWSVTQTKGNGNGDKNKEGEK